MKILQIVHYFPPSSLGGSELHTYQLSKELLKTHDVRLFFTIPEDKEPGKVEQGHYNHIPYWALKKNYCSFNQPFHERSEWVEQEFIKTLDVFKPDIVHFQHLINLSCTLPLLAKKRGVPCCFTLHDFWLLCPRFFLLRSDFRLCEGFEVTECLVCMQDQAGYYSPKTGAKGLLPAIKTMAKSMLNLKKKYIYFFAFAVWRRSIARNIFRQVDAFIAPSRFLLNYYMRHGLSSNKAYCICHGIPKNNLGGIQKTPSPETRFAFIGSLLVHKGINTLIDAFNRITGSATLKVYGRASPDMLQQLEKRSTNPGCTIMGELRAEDKQRAFAEIDVIIVPSLCYENCPLVILEAFTAGIPVIASEIGGAAELLENGAGGLTFPPGDTNKLAEKISVFINNPELITAMRSRLPAVKNMPTYAAEIESIYDQIQARKK